MANRLAQTDRHREFRGESPALRLGGVLRVVGGALLIGLAVGAAVSYLDLRRYMKMRAM